MYPLHHRLDDAQATRFCRKRIDLIGTPSDIPKETFNRIGTTNRAVHHLRERIKRQHMFFIFAISSVPLQDSAGDICLSRPMQYLTTLATQTTDEGTKRLIEAIQLALLGGDLSQVGQDLDGIYRQAWEAIVDESDTEEGG